MKFYLAHPFEDRNLVRMRQAEFEIRTKIKLFNPFYDEERSDIELLDKGIITPRSFKSKEKGREIVFRDLDSIDDCNGLLAYCTLHSQSIGTPMEIFYNSYVRHKRTYVIAEESRVRGHPWILALSDKVFTDWEDAITYFKKQNEPRRPDTKYL